MSKSASSGFWDGLLNGVKGLAKIGVSYATGGPLAAAFTIA